MNQPKNFTKKLTIISILSTIGAAVSIWQTRLFHLTRAGSGGGNHSFCNIGQAFDCTAIEMSPYAEVFGGLPLSGFAIAGYLVILILSLYGFSEAYRSNIRKLLLVFSGIAVLFSIAYLIIMIGTIGKFCLLCLGVDAINFLILILAFSLPSEKETYMPFKSINLQQLAGVGTVALVAAFLITKASNPQDGMKREDMNDIVESVLTTPVTPIELPSDTPIIGKADAPITIVKFFDFQCPACKMAANAVHPLLKRYPNDVKFAFLNFPLDMGCNPVIKNKMHEFACEAAALAVCANQQGKFEQAYDILFENQASFEIGKIADLLSSIPAIDMNKLKECSALPSTMEKIKAEIELGTKSKIESTPTFFLNGKKIVGGMPTNLWIEIIDKTLKNKN